MKTYSKEESNKILELHQLWLNGEEGGVRANLYGADLSHADLSRADLSGVNLFGADLSGANLSGANLRDADLSGANLFGANLYHADLSRANLSGVNLFGVNLFLADLSGANLWNCIGNRKQIKSIFISEIYPITYTATHLQIGCENHEISEWWRFDDSKINEMDGDKATAFWAKHKDLIKTIIESCPANATKRRNTMLDHLLDPDEYPECPKCGAPLELEGDKYVGAEVCAERCGYTKSWDNT